jgi:hypothetical protein
MVNYHDPVTIAREYAAVVKLWHVVDGIFIWEFFTTLDYEWDVIRGHRPYRWTIWVYSLTRVSTLLAVILNMVGFDTTVPINCQVWVTSEVIFAYLALATASLLIVLRVYVSHALRSPFRSKVLNQARQNRHLEQKEDYSWNHNGHMGDGGVTLHQWHHTGEFSISTVLDWLDYLATVAPLFVVA